MSLLDVRLVTPGASRASLSVLVLPVRPASSAPDGAEPDPEAADEPRAALASVAEPAPDALATAASAYLADIKHAGKAGELRTLPRPGERPATVHLVGIGDGTAAALRKTGAAAVRSAGDAAAIRLVAPAEADEDAFRGLVEGILLAGYRFTLASKAEPPKLRRVTIVVDDPERYADAVARATAVARAVHFARDLVNTPSDRKDPAWFAAQAVKTTAKYGVTAVVREPARLAMEGFNGILAVGGGSASGPRLVELKWAPRGATKHIVLVGKGITFDTGGISIKPAQGMQLMKKDMGGGAAVIGAVLAAAELKLPIKVTVLVPMAENKPSGSAYRPGDVVRHFGGRTSEILNTDAEGRVVLADALAYADKKLAPDLLVDLATLTGAQSVALGKRTAALFSDDDALVAALSDAAEAAGERVWRMPLAGRLRGEARLRRGRPEQRAGRRRRLGDRRAVPARVHRRQPQPVGARGHVRAGLVGGAERRADQGRHRLGRPHCSRAGSKPRSEPMGPASRPHWSTSGRRLPCRAGSSVGE